ncbi:hypothetical protein DCAR_0415039 [Daucus carota subsp. sativus]|uniref:GYF domain-containing protein n=1 Tax=Daucus carota subsp. sativus TaxID=79200 RepID=A0AAF0WTW2_DAUCS|nr:hypothetical protein DCAR_0415039 [Daucus carota subsp. sativus]
MANEDFWKEDSYDDYVPPKSKRTAKSKKMEYAGWGSKPLMEFLKEIGIETEKKKSQQELTAIINDYVSKNNLIKPSKKKRVECDEWLRYLFGKKFVLRIKIHELLFPHLAENRDESSDDTDSSDSGEEENGKIAYRKRKASVLGNKVTPNSKKVPESLKSCFASVIPENIKLVYLNKKSVLELLKDPETFESKVAGSYVRIKSDPYDYSQKNSHQLLQVTGARKEPACGDVSTAYFLQIPHRMKEIPVSKLSNENFKEEECEDLRQRIKTGSANRPTVTELQRKAQILHEVITKQWIAKELILVQNLIDHYLERKEMLKKPAEQERLLLEVPNVIAEELEPEASVQEPAEDEKNDVSCLPQLNIVGNGADIPFDGEADKSLLNDDFASTDSAADMPSDTEVDKCFFLYGRRTMQYASGNASNFFLSYISTIFYIYVFVKCGAGTCVIDLSDDDDEEGPEGINDASQIIDSPESSLWYYKDPQQTIQGPFSMVTLKKWTENLYFPSDFRIWKSGHAPVLLMDMLSLMFPH